MRHIPIHESLEIEFKSDLKSYPDHELIDEIVGMEKTEGGTLYLRVEDDGRHSGVHKNHRDPIGLTALIANSTVPPVSVRADLLSEDNHDILRIEIPKSRSIVSTSSGKILRRRLKTDGRPEVVPMYSYEIPTRLSDLGMLDFSTQPLMGASLEDLDPTQHARLRRIIQTRQAERNLCFLCQTTS